MSEGEYNSLMDAGEFLPYDKAMESKWFATTAEDATEWGKLFYPDGNYKMVEVQVPTSSLDDMFYMEKLDGIGPAYNAEPSVINNVIEGLKEIFK